MSPSNWIEIELVHRFIMEKLEGVAPKEAWGETSYFYNPDQIFERGTYFATIKQKDGENDRASNLDREGVWRLNMGVSKGAFFELCGPQPPRPRKGSVVKGSWDFKALDQLTPHPIYGWMSWVSCLNPSTETWERCMPLLADAHERAQYNCQRRLMKQKRTK